MNEQNHSNSASNSHSSNTYLNILQGDTRTSEALPEPTQSLPNNKPTLPAEQVATLPFASAVMASIIFLLLVLIVCLTIHHAAAPPALAAPRDADMEIQGTTEVVDSESGWSPPRYIFKGRVTNTGASAAPYVDLKAVFHYNYRNMDNSRQPLTGTILLSTFKNLRPGESREFECPVNVPQQPDSAPGTEAERLGFQCNVTGPGLPCFGGGLHNVPKPDGVTTEATVERAAN